MIFRRNNTNTDADQGADPALDPLSPYSSAPDSGDIISSDFKRSSQSDAAAEGNSPSTVVPSSPDTNIAGPNIDSMMSGNSEAPAQPTDVAPAPPPRPTDSAGKPSERRRRRRAKLAAPVLIRGGVGTVEAFQEVCSSVDVSRDGLLFAAGRSRYWVGQTLEVIFPYSSIADAATPAQRAQVMRTIPRPDKRYNIAIHFHTAMQQAGQTPVKTHSISGTRPTVLIVDPDPGSTAENRTTLEKVGYQVITVGTAHLALEVLKTETPALIIAEAEGEELGGRDLVLIIRKNDRLSHIPFLLVNQAHETAFENTATSQHGPVMCLVKPVRPERLAHVAKLLAPPPSQRSAYGADFGYGGVERTF
jgi:CheY-like chemotaxis protein